MNATEEPSTCEGQRCILGRLVNHARGREANAFTRIVSHKGEPRICIFAKRDIQEGDEILYDYGVSTLPWNMKSKVSLTFFVIDNT